MPIDAAEEFRVDTWKDYIGQEKLKERLDIHINAARTRKACRMENVLLHGPPGCGKTALAAVIANRFGSPFVKYIMPLSDKAMKRMVTEAYGVVLLDEIHRCSKGQQEELLTLVEDGYLSTKSGAKIENPYVTIIGATTERAKVIQPLYDRFNVRPEFEPYTDGQMAKIATGMLKRVGVRTSRDVAMAFGKASGGVPRNVASMVTMARDLQAVDLPINIAEVLRLCDVTEDGLTEQHVRYLTAIRKNGGGMGLAMLSTHLRLAPPMIMELERLLVERGYLEYNKTGRELTPAGHRRSQQLMKEEHD